MIGNDRIGSNGRLGNQMFQYASMRGVAAARGYDWVVPPQDYPHTANYALFETFNMSTVKPKNIGFVKGKAPHTIINEQDHCFNQDFFDNCPDNSSLEGFFQTEKYFKNVEDDIRSDFTFKDGYLKPCKEYIDSIETPPIFLHIRQADNIGREQFHPILPISYFEDALKNWSDDVPCFVFTDDIDWCKSQKFFQQDRFLFNDNVERYDYTCMDGLGNMQNSLLPQVDLCLMSLCSGGIVANSSFSWWGAWLQNDRGKVVAPDPKKWFGTSMTHLDTSDIVPDRWTIQEWSK